VLGLLLGLALTALFRLCRLRGRGPLEACYFLLCAYAAFCCGEALGLSGIIGSLFCGMMMGVYAKKLCSDRQAESLSGRLLYSSHKKVRWWLVGAEPKETGRDLEVPADAEVDEGAGVASI